MLKNENTAQKVASYLLQIKAIQLNIQSPYTWASGWKSPIYCDNRKVLSYPEVRTYIIDAFCKLIRTQYPDTELIAGVATAGIAHGALIAEKLELPMIYVRSKPKGHGLQNLIEGHCNGNEKVVVIEDLISSGGSTLKAVEALRTEGLKVLGALAIFTYAFDQAVQNFEAANCPFDTLSDYHALIELAAAQEYVSASDIISLKEWRAAPDKWGN